MIDNDNFEWYPVIVRSRYENKAIESLEQRRAALDKNGDIEDFVDPVEEKTVVQSGKRTTKLCKIMQGYILVKMRMNSESWYIVRYATGVSGFTTDGEGPAYLSKEEVDRIFERMNSGTPRVVVEFKIGESVRITDGPFNEFIGNISEIDSDRERVTVMLSLFGRETPVELDFIQVEKL